ncbi:MAG: Sugar-specific transcriptional regulator TrmB [Methanoregula sp. PtaU1.Bin051]|nr:MAG: Sugar-specific transcriptional regulator TrmB [Methanoregula sp. PtaU1.Bin051]
MFLMDNPDLDRQPIVHQLRSLGLTKYESLVYIALLRVADATATEIHGLSGVPRASVYPVLSQLQEKELVSISQSSPKRFAARPPEEGIRNLLSKIERAAQQAEENLSAIYQERLTTERTSQELIWNLYGIAAIRKKLVELVGQATSSVRIMAHRQLFSDDLTRALSHKSEQALVEVFTHDWDTDLPPTVRVTIKKPPELLSGFHKAKGMMAGGICVIDDKKILVVIGSGDEDAVALYSESEGFVRFFSRYYSLVRDLADRAGQ